MSKNRKVLSAEVDTDSSALTKTVLGTYDGECADASITNENGLDITYDVWDNVFNSDIYKKALAHGWYIGYLGHPEDPNCMDFEHACIVMTEGHIDDDGKVYGKFNLIDTPVGRIVAAFQDAGVKFGISVRGAGDIVNNSVDPDTFIFRGFDLVTFPAFPDAIPEFTKIAAATDTSSQKKYKAVCAAVKANIDGLNTPQAVTIIKSQFAPQSEEYKMLEKRESELEDLDPILGDDEDPLDISEDKIKGLLHLYLEEKQKNEVLSATISGLKNRLKIQGVAASRKLRALQRITTDQYRSSQSIIASSDQRIENLQRKLRSSSQKITASEGRIHEVENQLHNSESQNLKYKQKIQSSQELIQDKDATISHLKSQLSETVGKVEDMQNSASNRDEQMTRIKSEIEACNKLIEEYQDAYASLYASALGVSLDNVTVTSSTSVRDLQKLIKDSSSQIEKDTILSNSTLGSDEHVDILGSDDDLVTL